MKKLLIIGAGGHGQVLAEVAMACGYDRVDFLDDRNPCAVGTTDRAEVLAGRYDGVIVSIGNNDLRRAFIQRLQAVHAPIATLVHPRAFVAPSASLGEGSVVLPGAVVNTHARVGKGCILSIGALVDHDARIDDFSHINAGAIVAAGERAGGKIDPGGVVG